MGNVTATTRFAVEGLYVDRAKADPKAKPSEWPRVWKTWMECSDEARVTAVLRNGLGLLALNEFSGFSDLRVVRINEYREVLNG